MGFLELSGNWDRLTCKAKVREMDKPGFKILRWACCNEKEKAKSDGVGGSNGGVPA